MAGLGDIFKEGSTAEQFLVWGVLQQLLQPLLAPVTTELGKLVFSAVPDVPISPTDAAAAVGRYLLDDGSGQDKANDSGIGHADFEVLVDMARNSPAVSMVLELYRRGLIGVGSPDGKDVSVRGALADQGVRADWHDLVLKLATSIPTQAEVLNAWLEGQIEPGEAHDRLLKAGMDPAWIQTAYNASGEAPTPVQALELLNRGIIPERGTGPGATSYEQAFLEGPWRNKWLASFIALREYLPPPRTVTAMFHDGQITHDQAAALLVKQGLSAELAAAYLAPTQTHKTATDRHLAKSDITTAYADGIMPHARALAALEALGYSPHDAAVVLDLVDVRVTTAQVTAGVSRARSLFAAGKITEQDARAVLVKLGMTAAQAGEVTSTWTLTQSHQVRTLTATQVESAWYYGLLTADDALGMLQGMGYDAFDAWIVLAVRGHGPVKGVPRPASPFAAPPTVKPL